MASGTAGPTTRPLAGRTALITGAGSGLGRAIALRFALGGAFVLAADVNVENACETVKLAVAAGGDAAELELDVTDAAMVTARVHQVFDRFGARFDVLVNNAGTDRGAGILDVTESHWNHVLAVNQSGPLYTTREFLRRIVADGPRQFPADVVNVISISAITVGTDAAAYNSSKAALAKLTEIMQREAYEYGWPARIHGLMPSAMDTPMMARWQLADEVMMAPDTVARAVEFMVCLPPDTFVQNLIINSRREPGWPR
jgi:NAD(P)-dependent dehydrogenase (short-subunit alcohol dehydrogenase family)